MLIPKGMAPTLGPSIGPRSHIQGRPDRLFCFLSANETPSNAMKPSVMPLAAVLTACSLATASAASDPSATPASSSTQEQGTPSEPSSPDYKLVDDQIHKYEEAYNRGDAK